MRNKYLKSELLILITILIVSCTTKLKEVESATSLYDYDVEQKLIDLGIALKTPQVPPGIKIELASKFGNLIYLSGNGPISDTGEKTTGKVGIDLTIEQGYEAARLTAINHLSVLKEEIGDLNKIVKIVKVFGMVNSESSFEDHPQVINGYSDLLVEVFGDRGKHARSAVGMISLPWNIAIEIEAIVEIRE